MNFNSNFTRNSAQKWYTSDLMYLVNILLALWTVYKLKRGQILLYNAYKNVEMIKMWYKESHTHTHTHTHTHIYIYIYIYIIKF